MKPILNPWTLLPVLALASILSSTSSIAQALPSNPVTLTFNSPTVEVDVTESFCVKIAMECRDQTGEWPTAICKVCDDETYSVNVCGTCTSTPEPGSKSIPCYQAYSAGKYTFRLYACEGSEAILTFYKGDCPAPNTPCPTDCPDE